MNARRKYRGTVSIRTDVDVNINEILEEISDEDLKGELAQRAIPVASGCDFDLLDELHFELRRGKVNNALALIESAQNARLITEAQRQHQFQSAGKAAH